LSIHGENPNFPWLLTWTAFPSPSTISRYSPMP
jgi:hypothetical protein